MSIQQGIYEHLTTSPFMADLQALVVDRVYPNFLPSGDEADPDLPGISYFRVSSNRQHAHQGYTGANQSVFQFNCWGKTYTDSENVAKALRQFTGYIGGLGTQPFFVGGVRNISERDDFLPDAILHNIILEFEIDICENAIFSP